MASTLLCVQHDRKLARVYAEALTAEGYEVLSAQDGRSALEILRKQNPALVVLDIYLPRQDGFEVLAELRMRPACAKLPVVLLSEGDVTEDVAKRARKLGAVGVESTSIDPTRLLATIAKQVKGAAKEKVTPVSRIPGEGSLKQVPVPELLRSLHVDAVDGVLLLDHGRKKKAIELRGGWPVSVKSNLISECFGNYLITNGRCTKSQLDESVKRMRTGEGLQGEILVAMDVLDEDAVVEALAAHALEKFLEIFSWRDGQYRIRPNAHVQRGSSFGIGGHPSRLIVSGVQRHFPMRQIDRYLEIHGDAFLVRLPDEGGQLDDMQLEKDEAAWVRRVDGSQTLSSLLEAPEAIRRLAFGLISIELLGVGASASDPTDVRVANPEPVDATAVSAGTETKTDAELRVELAQLANSIQNKDHYETLGVASTADDEEIRSAYAGLAKRAHPDRFHGASSSVRQLASQVFDRIAQAHAAIATTIDRKAYAAELSRGLRATAVVEEGRRALEAETEYQKGEKRVAQRDYEGALLCFGRAMENFPSEGEYHSQYGWCLYLCHPDNEVMLGEALEHCREGVKLAKDREKPYLLLGRLYKATGRVGAAKKMFMRAVEIRPQCVEAMRELRIMNMRRAKDKGVLKRIFRR